MKIFAFLFGSRRVSVSAEQGADLLNICMKYRFSYYAMGSSDGRTYVVGAPAVARRIAARCREHGLPAELGGLAGAPLYISRFFSRGGLVLGTVLAAVLLLISQNYVWDIRISGYDGLDAAAIEAGLADCGFARGTRLSGFSADAVENLFLRNSEDIGWISVNMKGTVAYVEVMEKKTPPKKEPSLPANVVASSDGEIVEVITYSGLRMVEVGEIVRAGDLLICGAYGDKTPGLHLTHAAGRVTARTFRTVCVEIPLEFEEKVETGRTFRENYIIFFGNSIKVFGNYGNLGSTCDKIVEGKKFDFLGSTLPIGQKSDIYVEYETVKSERSRDEAKMLAADELEKRIAELGAEKIEKRNDTVHFTDRACIIVSELTCLENIAKTIEFKR